MEYNHDEVYCFKTINGTQKTIKKVPEIEKMISNINEMSDIGKLTDLLWGYNVVTDAGVVLRKFKFLSDYPDKAKKIVNIVYPVFYYLNDFKKMQYRDKWLSEKIFNLIGFTIIRTASLR